MASMDTKSNRESAAKVSIIISLIQDELKINKLINKQKDFETLTSLLTLKDILKTWRRNVGD